MSSLARSVVLVVSRASEVVDMLLPEVWRPGAETYTLT
jgi:hypothetical protein